MRALFAEKKAIDSSEAHLDSHRFTFSCGFQITFLFFEETKMVNDERFGCFAIRFFFFNQLRIYSSIRVGCEESFGFARRTI